MLVKGLIRFPFLPGTHVTWLSKRNHWRDGGSGKARHVWEELVGIGDGRVEHFTPHVLASEPAILLQRFLQQPAVHRGKPAAPCLLHSASRSLPSFSATVSPEASRSHSITEVPPRRHPAGLPFTHTRAGAATLPLGPQWTGSKLTLHTSSESPQQNRVPIARCWLTSGPDWDELVSWHLSHRISLFNDQLTCGI